jgi:hypothetical protein
MLSRAMLPASAIKQLNDQLGRYVIHVQCRVCSHARDIRPLVLARICGWDAELSRVIPRMRCSQGGKKNCDVKIGFDAKPRRWNTHP